MPLSAFDDLTLGEIIQMSKARDEELQISWACSAQNADLLPESLQKKPSKKSKQQVEKHLKGIFE